MKKKALTILALCVALTGCAVENSGGMTQNPELKIAYTPAGIELFKQYNFYVQAMHRDEKVYGMEFAVNDQTIKDDIRWVHFDNNNAVYQIDKSDDIQEQNTMMNPHYLVFKGKQYETDNSDDFWVVGDQLIHYRCLEQEYHADFDRNICTHRAIFASESMVDSIQSDEFNSIELRIRDGNKIYYSIYSEPPHEVFDFSVKTHNQIFSYDVLTKKKESYMELDDLHLYGIQNGEPVISSYDKPLRVGQKSYGVSTIATQVTNGNVYYIPEEDKDQRMARGVGEKHYISLLRNQEKIGGVFTDDDMPEIEDGTKAYCGSFLRPLFTPLLCTYGEYYFAKSQVGRGGGMKHILDTQRQVEDLDEYYINGKQLSFYPDFDTPYSFSCQQPPEGQEQKEMVQGVGFLFDKNQKLSKLLIVAQDGCLTYGTQKLYSADYSASGEITNPVLLMEYEGELFGYTIKN